MTDQTVTIDGADLCFETFGDPDHATVLLIAGGGQSMVWWEDDFCARLAKAGRHVVRYDHRDTGRSASSPAGQPSYTGEDLATDPLRLLDHLGVAAAHIVGLSLGGGIAQYLALASPERVRTLCVMSSSPWVAAQRDHALPGPAPQILATFSTPDPEPDWTDRDAVIDYRVDIERPYAGSLGFDEPRFRRLATLEVDRTHNIAASLTNHFILEEASLGDARLEQVTVPTLVLHGTADPMFPVEHGEALAADIPGSRFVPLPGVGHQQPPPELWDVVVDAIVDLTVS